MIGRSYLLHGEPVTVRARWLGNHCPRNVLIELSDGSLTVRPFRGLRRLPTSTTAALPPPEFVLNSSPEKRLS